MAEPRTITIVLVHGAFAESLSNWKPVLELLLAKGYKVVAAPNPLRGVSSDAAYISSILNTIDGPIILVGHSYGGAVITNAANGNQSVKALVYVAAFAPDTGESVATLLRRFPGSTVEANTAAPILLADGSRDLYFQPDKFRAQYAEAAKANDYQVFISPHYFFPTDYAGWKFNGPLESDEFRTSASEAWCSESNSRWHARKHVRGVASAGTVGARFPGRCAE
jgi:pimeloyl-ACP methyl ester carboxylesterase